MSEQQDRKRINVRMHPDLFVRAEYWAERHGLTINEYVVEALAFKIAWENGDYPLPTMEQQRLQEIVGVLSSLTSAVNNSTEVTTRGFATFTALTKGDSNLLDDDNGELPRTGAAYQGGDFDQ